MFIEKITIGLLWYLAFIFSLTLHEAAHAFAAYKLGDRTAYEGGQVSIDPLPHIRREPLGTIVVPIISYLLSGWMFGWASTPYDPYWASTHPKHSALMALAGPATNLMLVILSSLAIRLGIVSHIFIPPEQISFTQVTAPANAGFLPGVVIMISILFFLNLVLFIFNLFPLPPLDGSGALPLLFNEKTSEHIMDFMRQPAFRFLGIFIAWELFDVIFPHFHLASLNILYFGVATYGN